MNARNWVRALPAVLTVAAAVPAAASAHEPGPPVTGHVYVNDNTPGVNTIAAFDRHPDGSLSPEPGSPFAAGGAGTGAGLPSQGAVQLAGRGRFLIAVDAASNEVSVLRISRDGPLRLVDVVPSGGASPDSVTIHDHLVYVANSGSGGTNLSGFRLTRRGHLRPVPGSTVALPDGSTPGDVLFNRTGTRLVATLVGPSQIASFTVGRGGRLTAAPGSPFAAQGLGPFGSAFSPAAPDELFVSNAHNTAPDSGTVSAFRDGPGGVLSSVGGSPFADAQMAPCWVEVSHDGRYLYAVNTASGSVSSYAIAPDGGLALLGSTPLKAAGPAGAVDARLSPDGRTLYVVESQAGAVAAFAVRGGALSELAGSPFPLPAGAAAGGLATN